jgi:hypothetical protein
MKRFLITLGVVALMTGFAVGPTTSPLCKTAAVVHAQEQEIRFRGTVIGIWVVWDAGGWIVDVTEVISGPAISGRVQVWTHSFGCDKGYVDPDIQAGDQVEVYGLYWYCSDCTYANHQAEVCWSDDYYIRILQPGVSCNIWVDKGEGADYCIDEPITLCYSVSSPIWIQIWVITSERTWLYTEYFDDGTGDCFYETIGPPTGSMPR